jgi:hypothetical protein
MDANASATAASRPPQTDNVGELMISVACSCIQKTTLPTDWGWAHSSYTSMAFSNSVLVRWHVSPITPPINA